MTMTPHPMNRPKGWPMCAGRAAGIVFMIFLFVGLEWLGIYTSLFVNFFNRLDFFSGAFLMIFSLRSYLLSVHPGTP